MNKYSLEKLTGDDEVGAGADRLDSQETRDLALVLPIVGQGCVYDPQVVNPRVLIADQL